MNAELLRKAGVDYEVGLERFMNDTELYEAVLTAFAGEDLSERARRAFDSGDRTMLLRVVHEAKGSSGNAGLDGIYAEASALVTLLRGQSCTDDELSESFRRFEAAYKTVKDGVDAALNS